MELHNTMAILALCLLLAPPIAEASVRGSRLDHNHRRAPKSTSTTTAKPDGDDAKPDSRYKNQIKFDPIEVQYQLQQFPNPTGDEKPIRHSSPLISQTLNQQQVNLQQLQLPAVTPQLHPFHQQQIIQMIQRALYATQRHNQPTAMIIIAQPAAQQQHRPGYHGPHVGQTQPLLNYFQQENQQAKYQLSQETAPQQIHPYNAESNPTYQAAQNYQVIPASSFQYQPSLNLPTPNMPTTHMSPVQLPEAFPHHLSQLSNFAQLAAQQYTGPAPEYLNNAQQSAGHAHTYQGQDQQTAGPLQTYSSPAQNYHSNAQALVSPPQSYQPSPAAEYYGAAHQFQFGTDPLGGSGRGGVPVRSLPPIITGFENFSPEQQEKIKEQLSAHFGAPLKLLPGKGDGGQYQSVQNGGFVPSQQVNEGRSARSSSIMSIAKTSSKKM